MKRPPILFRDGCLDCQHPFTALSQPALDAAIADHGEHVRTNLNFQDDPHFEHLRMDQLIFDVPNAPRQ